MDFNWAAISFIDIGIFSFAIVAVATGWLVKKREDKRYNDLLEQHTALQQEFRAFQSAADRRYNALQEEHEKLKEENAILQAALDAMTKEQKALQAAHHHLAGRHDELVERVMPVFEILAREKLIEINQRNQN